MSKEQKRYHKKTTQKEEPDEIEISPNVKELSGIISLPKNLDVKDNLRKYMMEKLKR